MKTNKTILSMSISAILLAACGGGGSGGAGQSISVTSSNTTSTVTNPNQNSNSTYASAAYKDKQAAATGKGETVLLVDTGVNLNNAGVKGKDINPQMLATQNAQYIVTTSKELGDDHGTHMAEIIVQHAPQVHIEQYAYNIDNRESVTSAMRGAVEMNKRIGGKSIINNSYGSSYFSDLNAYKPHATIIKEAIDSGALMLFAVGNETNDNPEMTARLPLVDSSLEKGFIAVAGTSNGKMKYNHCGVSMNFCISAEALHDLKDNSGNKITIGGTSSATAHVSATAAKIRARYDWMTNTQIKETLFTTATDAGAKGVDSVYGVGIMNSDKALNGYGRFDTRTVLNVDGAKSIYYFDNAISGVGGLTKNGGDTLVLNGANTYSGSNIINQGKLILNNTNKAASVVNTNGTLSVGDANVISSGKITNNGTVESTTTSNLNVNGDFVNGKTGTINKAIGSSINVSGNLIIQGGKLSIVGVAKGYVTTVGKTENLITSNGIEGSFDSVSAIKVSDLINNTVNIDGKNISVKTQRANLGDVAMPQAAYEGKSTAVNNVNKLLSGYDAVVDSGGELTGDAVQMASVLMQSQNITKTLFEQGTETVKHGFENLNQTEIKQNNQFVDNMQTQANGVWVDYGYKQGRLDLDGLSGKSEDNTLTIGGAYQFDQYTIGGAVSYKDLAWRENFQGSSKTMSSKGYGVDLGYVYRLNQYGLYAIAGYNRYSNEVFNKANADQFNVGIGVNRLFSFERWVLQPNFGLQYVYTKSGNIKTSNLVSVDGLTAKQLVADVGVKAIYQVTNNINVFGNLNVEHDLSVSNKYNANYAGTSFHNKDNDIGKTRVNVGIGAQYNPTKNLSVGVVAKHEQGNNWKSNSVNATLGYKF